MASSVSRVSRAARKAALFALAALLAASCLPAAALAAPAAAEPAPQEAMAEERPAATAAQATAAQTAAPVALPGVDGLPLASVPGAGGALVEHVEVSVAYADQQRTTADITFHKAGDTSQDVSVIFLVDASQYGADAYRQWRTVMLDQGLSYLFDHGAASDMRVIYYQGGGALATTGSLSNVEDATAALNGARGITIGQGIPHELTGLNAARAAIAEEAQAHPGRQVALVWVLSDYLNPNTDQAQLASALSAVADATAATDGAFITWQLGANTPSQLLAAHTTQHLTDPHNPNSMGSASFAAATATAFRQGLREDVENIAHNHFHNVTGTLMLAGSQSLVTGVTGAQVATESPFVSMDVQVVNTAGNPVAAGQEGAGIRFTLGHVCRQSDIDVTVQVRLNPTVDEAQEVFPATTIHSPRDHSNGGLHVGLFDEALLDADTSLEIPAVTLSRAKSTMTFLGPDGRPVYELSAIEGSPVTIPTADGVGSADGTNLNPSILTSGDSAFGGWHGSDGSLYGAASQVAMPGYNLVLTATYGKAYAQLDLGEVTKSEYGNRLAEQTEAALVNLSGVTLADGATVLTQSDIVNVVVEDKWLDYTANPSATDARRVSVAGNSAILYARHVGATENDRVVAYVVANVAQPGKYDIHIAGFEGVTAPANSFTLFKGMPGENFDMQALNTAAVTNMSGMFRGCTATSINCAGWDTTRVTDMQYLFADCSALESLDVTGWDTLNVTSMAYMFQNCTFLTSLDVKTWNVSNVCSMLYMFRKCEALTFLDVADWKTGNVTNMGYLFSGCSSLESLDVSRWDTSSVTNMGYLFDNCASLKPLDVSNWKTERVTSMARTFSGCSAVTELNVSNWKTGNVTNMSFMFSGCKLLTALDVSNWQTGNVVGMESVFRDCEALIRLDVSNWQTSKATNMGYLFYNCGSLLDPLDVSNWDVSKVQNMTGLFWACRSLTKLDVSKWNTGSATTMGSMFRSCEQIETLDLGNNWDMSHVTNTSYMFYGASALAEVKGKMRFSESPNDPTPLSDVAYMFHFVTLTDCSFMAPPAGSTYYFTTSSLHYMFQNAQSLKQVDLSGWSLPNLTDVSAMFQQCRALQEINLSWQGECGLKAAQSPELANCFTGVPSSAKLEIGTDNDARPSLDMIAREFLGTAGRQVTVGGVAHTPAAASAAAVMAAGEEDAPAPVADEAVGSGAAAGEAGEGEEDAATGAETDRTAAEEEGNAPASANAATENYTNAPAAAEDTRASAADRTASGQEGSASEASAARFSSAEAAPATEASAAQGTAATGANLQHAAYRSGTASTAAPQTAAYSPLGAAARTVVTEDAQAADEGNWEWAAPGASSLLRIHGEATKPGSKFRYRLRVGYEGDVGAASGRISFTLPLPNEIEVLDQSDSFIGADETVVMYSNVLSDGTDGGFQGGYIAEAPALSPDGRSVSGAVEGLYAGNYIEVTVACKIKDGVFDYDDHTDSAGVSYDFWDAQAAITSSGNAGVSNWYRLWNANSDTAAVPDDGCRTVSYTFAGEVPPDVQVPLAARVKAGEPIPVPPSEATTSRYGWYQFAGWAVGDQPLAENTPMGTEDITVVGTWQRPSGIPSVTVRYAFKEPAPAGAEALLPPQEEIPVGRNAFLSAVLASAGYASFAGYWEPTVTVNGQEVALGTTSPFPNAGSHYTGIYTPLAGGTAVSISLPTTGTLDTMQFAEAFAGQGADVEGEVVITYTGSWVPWSGTIVFNGQGAEGTPPAPLGDATWDDPRTLPGPSPLVAPRDYEFAGWALAPGGAVARGEGDSASGLVSANHVQVTLYAKWARADGYDILWNAAHAAATPAPSTASYGDTVTATLVPEEGYVIEAVAVSMAGRDITSQAWDAATGQVSFTVTGDVQVTATATKGLRVTYVYAGDVPSGAALPAADLVHHSGSHKVAAPPAWAGYSFVGWVPSLFVDGQPVELGLDGSWTHGVVRAAHQVPATGTLEAAQFAELLQADHGVEVRYTGTWAREDNNTSATPGTPEAPGASGNNPADKGAASANDANNAHQRLSPLLARTGDALGPVALALAGVAVLALGIALASRRLRRRS